MKKIPLTQGKVALVDDADYEYLMQWKWHAEKSGKTYYAARQTQNAQSTIRSTVRMHQVILCPAGTQECDHRSGNGLNNQRSNLRPCSSAQNSQNRQKSSRNTSGFKGVDWKRDKKKWRAQIMAGGKPLHLGYFFCIVKAAKAYDEAAKEYFGEYARPNFA